MNNPKHKSMNKFYYKKKYLRHIPLKKLKKKKKQIWFGQTQLPRG